MNFDKYYEQIEMENQLKQAYHEYWGRLMKVISSLSDEERQNLSNPHLIKVLPSYFKTDNKILFVGQETNGWEYFDKTLAEFHHGDFEIDREQAIDYIQWLYEDFRMRGNYEYTPFWKGMKRLYTALTGKKDKAFLNTQLNRFDLGGKRVPAHLENTLLKEFNVLPLEIQALQPNIVIFLTGPYYDERIRKTFNGYGLGNNIINMVEIHGFSKNELVRLEHDKLPFHTYRTYHPGYSLRHEQDVFTPISNELKRLINGN